MIDIAFKNIMRQRTRTVLTIIGIVIGIAAVVSLGSISEGLNENVKKNLEITAGKIIVSQKGSSGFLVGFSGSELNDEHLQELSGVAGVREVVPQLYFVGPIEPFHGPEWVGIGIEPEKTEFFSGENIRIEKGRVLEAGDNEVILAGNIFAEKRDLEIGDFFTVKETDMEIVGILEKSGIENIDQNFIVPLETLQTITGVDTFRAVYVIPENVRDVEVVADKVEDVNEDFEVLTSKDIARQASQLVNQIRFFTLGVGAIAALVGGLGIMNTMVMSVLERRREIGVLKAIGATNRKVLVNFLTEAGIISLIGGIFGILFGIGGAYGLSRLFGFEFGMGLTPTLFLSALGFAIVLGLAGGLYPAWKAARVDPVEALRYE